MYTNEYTNFNFPDHGYYMTPNYKQIRNSQFSYLTVKAHLHHLLIWMFENMHTLNVPSYAYARSLLSSVASF